MLPFLDKKKSVSIIMSRRGKTPDIEVNSEVEAPGSEMDPMLKEAAEDMMRAMETKSVMDLAMALKAAFEVCQSPSMPEEEEAGE